VGGMNIVVSSILAVILSYLIGSLPSAYLVGRLVKGIDIRKTGTGNMGAMNVFYKVGFWPGMLVGTMDAGKGALAVWVGTLICQLTTPPSLVLLIVQMLCGISAIMGHNWPAYLGFKRGGRGGATVVGILFFMVPLGIPFYILFLVLVLAITRFPTISYVAAMLVFPILSWAQGFTGLDAWIQQTWPALAWTRTRGTDAIEHILLIIYPFIIMTIPVMLYIPRIKEIFGRAGRNLKRAIFRGDIKENL